MTLDLGTRSGWPTDLAFLLEAYPRETWPTHPNLGATAQFWLRRHAMFREFGAVLDQALGDFREGALGPDRFRPFFVRRLQLFLSELEAHHHIEDLHYFPVFRAAEARLALGFDVLESDHGQIHAQIVAAAEAANSMLARLHGDPDALSRATDLYAAESGRLLRSLGRHLDDEEDLIVPVILDRSETGLGIAP